MSPTLVWKAPPSGINVAGTWVCPTIVTFDLRTCQIAGCKKENSLITTHVRSWALHEPDGCAFCGCGASGCLRATHGTWTHWALSEWGGFRVLLLCCCVRLWTRRPSDQNCIQMTSFAPAASIVPVPCAGAGWFCQVPWVSSQWPLFLWYVGLQQPCRKGHWQSSFPKPNLLQYVAASRAGAAKGTLFFLGSCKC